MPIYTVFLRVTTKQARVGTQQKTTIDINGKRYDARTGRLLHDHKPAVATHKPEAKKPTRTALDITRPATAKHVHKTAERSKTLMRHAVKKPSATPVPEPRQTAVQAMSDVTKPAVKAAVNAVATLHHHFDSERVERAQKIKRSSLVSKFSDFSSPASGHAAHKKVQPLAVQPAPAHAPAAPPHSPSSTMLENGLKSAQSHTQHHKAKKTKSRRSKLVRAGAGGMAVLLMSVFIAYQNVPNMSVRYAAAKAGVSARLPGYSPSGFALDRKIEYTPGKITIQFASNSDDRHFTITQRSSNWNSDTLMSNYVATASDQVHMLEDKGRTIYLYGDSNATWVNGGIWYEIDGNSQLTSNQLIRIASSM